MTNNFKWPNFLVVGAPKCATTSIYNYFSDHPDVFLSKVRKEGRFFSEINRSSIFWPKNYPYPVSNSINDYKKLFDGFNQEKLVGDISPDYLSYSSVSSKKIFNYCGPETKIVIIVRDPIDRSFSHYIQNVRRGAEHFSFKKSIEIEKIRKLNNWGFQWLYSDTSFYSERIGEFKKLFKNVLILTKHGLERNTKKTLIKLHNFLHIDFDSKKSFPKSNKGGVQKSKIDTVLSGIYDNEEKILLDKSSYHGEKIEKKPNVDTSFDTGGELIPIDLQFIDKSLLKILREIFSEEINLIYDNYGIKLNL